MHSGLAGREGAPFLDQSFDYDSVRLEPFCVPRVSQARGGVRGCVWQKISGNNETLPSSKAILVAQGS